jgi:putative NADPH-quinone reductase
MHALVLIAHPCDDSFTHVAARTAIKAIETAGHSVDVIDLYADRFQAHMSYQERIAYETDDPISDPQVADHAARLRRADVLVFVYPTWWSGQPAILKGWLERVMVPGVGFFLNEKNKVVPGLRHVRRIVGISTYGSPRRYVWLMNDNGRRVVTRALRLSCSWRTRTTWLALYSMDTATALDRGAFLDRLAERLARL